MILLPNCLQRKINFNKLVREISTSNNKISEYEFVRTEGTLFVWFVVEFLLFLRASVPL